MMKSLVIDCSLNPRAENRESLEVIQKFTEYSSVQFRDIHPYYEIKKDVDAVVLSGSKARIVDPSHRSIFKGAIELIKRIDLPLFGVCFGHQLLCWVFGCKVASLAEAVIDRFEEVRVVEVDEIFADFEENQTLRLAESHYDYVRRDSLDSAGFVLLADSQSCEVEAVKHKCNPFYGVQFHPERLKIKGQTSLEGQKVIENFYRNIVKR